MLLKSLSVKPQLDDVIENIPLLLIAFAIYESGSMSVELKENLLKMRKWEMALSSDWNFAIQNWIMYVF